MDLRFGEESRVEKYPIQMVPLLMREEGNEEYEPKVVSLGPYHHGKEKLKFVEDFKPTALQMFIGNSSKGYGDLLSEVLRNIGYAKSCYLQEYTSIYTDEEFARMMILDACVILNNIGLSSTEESVNQAKTINHLGTPVYTSIRRDMYLLENQVPFRILEMLVWLRDGTPRHAFVKHIENFCFRMFFHDKEGNFEEANHTNDHNKQYHLHLVGILRSVITTVHDHEPKSNNDHGCYDINNLESCLDNSGCCGSKDDDGMGQRGLYVFRSVTDLKSKGIKSRGSGIPSLKGVRFSPTELCRPAKLKLPLLHVDMYTRVFFKNMIAYEFSPNVYINDKCVTAYVSFMKLLVVSKMDVKELRENKIIINSLGSDEEVVQLFNALNTYGAEDNSSFWQVKRDVEDHYNSKAKTWIADLGNMYFSNPWSIIALAGSIFLLCLDIVQTYYSVNSNNAAADQSSSKRGL
ncbi:hypothetical protein HAX54_024083 [Datura stramonium]|uniref:Uncharacterized protein n=1 Tax=Datura stramonium TaxID=4076 RepID=A0ABS8UZ39_DATST|nr:hypothetical protein [Datura stramonium]